MRLSLFARNLERIGNVQKPILIPGTKHVQTKADQNEAVFILNKEKEKIKLPSVLRIRKNVSWNLYNCFFLFIYLYSYLKFRKFLLFRIIYSRFLIIFW